MTLESLIAEAGGRGLLVNNLFQIPGGWQSNVCRPQESYYEFGRGPTAEAALRAALDKAAAVGKTVAPDSTVFG